MSLLLLFNQAASGGYQTYTDAFAETFAVSDEVGSKGAYASSVSESTTLTGTFAATQVFSADLSDGVSMVDAYAATVAFRSSLSDQLALADTYGATATFSASMSDQLFLADVYGATVAFRSALADQFALSDAYGATSSVSESLLAQLALADSLMLGGTTYSDSFVEQVALSDGATAKVIIAESLGEAIAVAASIGATQIQISSIGETFLLNATFDGVRIGAVWPAPSNVLLGVQYGPTGIEFTGTATTGPSRTVFAQQMFVTTAVEKEVVTLTESRCFVTERPGENTLISSATADKVVFDRDENLSVITKNQHLTVKTCPTELFILTNQEIM